MNTRKALKLDDVSRMPLSTVEWFWRDDFDSRTTIVVAMSQNMLRHKVEQALICEPFLRETLDAVRWAEAELLIACERFRLMEDSRLGKTRYNLRCIQALRERVHSIFSRQQTKINKDTFTPAGTKATLLAERLMIELFPQELHRLHQEMAAERQMPAYSPWGHHETATLNDYIERAVHEDMVRVLKGSRHAQLRAMEWPTFLRTVQDDARSQNDRVPELRDLRLRSRWQKALDELLERIAPAAQGEVHSGCLRSVEYADMPMDEAQAMIRARRAFLSIWQRRQELNNLTKVHTRTMERLRAQFSEPWKELALDARIRLGANHPEVLTFLLEELRPYTVDGEQLQDEVLKGRPRGDLRRKVKEAARARFPAEVEIGSDGP